MNVQKIACGIVRARYTLRLVYRFFVASVTAKCRASRNELASCYSYYTSLSTFSSNSRVCVCTGEGRGREGVYTPVPRRLEKPCYICNSVTKGVA